MFEHSKNRSVGSFYTLKYAEFDGIYEISRLSLYFTKFIKYGRSRGDQNDENFEKNRKFSETPEIIGKSISVHPGHLQINFSLC